ncbi:NAD(P)/FAD-dependent oxidoreductase [Brasilonema octagenarum UFV-E1]|uniref:NAD(P)/FAD-dependent oxidoreductase n=1 Tax=Brasilonema sennae CENA114 TaxID=415709 RepID=A0A856MHL2_9CYAN|nr:NAD(P)-binding domain-containing protein [Brasilonema sennae]QDL10855.1 NAD(P)/FAD-dependent oxidoreductase [Brasilonema sennae CENA114]QDL17200.1 NAD(P)/FAD-dependent oxidoreductase [Brasilonema octagenarum UFV-E1]
MVDTTHKHLIIGAGFVGLGMAEALKGAGIPYDQVDASDDIGGNWYHGVYETAHIISSRKITQFTHFPMPDDYPDFPSAQNMRDYLNAFANHFDLRQHIELNRSVNYVRPIENNLWEVTFTDGKQRIYKGVLVCNGHHWCKRFPELKGEFNGEIIHSKDYKRLEMLRGKRVLVIGSGNSACDIAAEAARVGAKCVLSMRESVWFIPKTFAGIPFVDLLQWWMPEWFQRLTAYGIMRLTFGKHEEYGLSKPNHQVFDKHPTINNEVPYYIKHGRIIPKPTVRQLNGWEVEFIDGSCEEFDLIVCATGYDVAYSFLPQELQRVEGSVVKCYGGAFPDDYKGLYYIGWGQVRGGVGSVIAASSPLFIRCLKLQDEINVPIGLVFKEMGQQLPTTHLSDPQKTFRELKLTNFLFNRIVKKAHQVDAQYPIFRNTPLLPNTVQLTEKGVKCDSLVAESQ